MRVILLTLALLGTIVAVAPAASADEVYCHIGDLVCWTECKLDHRDLNLLYDTGHCHWIYGP